MERFASLDGVRIAYVVQGAGPDVLLLHGFAADHVLNWARPGVIDALVRAGRRVIALDARGHGASDKPHEPAAYDDGAMVSDARALLDHLRVRAVDVVGYSMGGMVAARLAAADPRVRSLVLGGVGGDLVPPLRAGGRDALVEALLAEDAAAVTHPIAKGFRAFAERTGADRRALAAVQRSNGLAAPVQVEALTLPTLVLAGEDDTLIPSPEALAARLPHAQLVRVPGDHLSAVAAPAFREAIARFLAAHGGATGSAA